MTAQSSGGFVDKVEVAVVRGPSDVKDEKDETAEEQIASKPEQKTAPQPTTVTVAVKRPS